MNIRHHFKHGVCGHSHINSCIVSFVSCIHGALDDLRSEITRGPTHLCVKKIKQLLLKIFVTLLGKV